MALLSSCSVFSGVGLGALGALCSPSGSCLNTRGHSLEVSCARWGLLSVGIVVVIGVLFVIVGS